MQPAAALPLPCLMLVTDRKLAGGIDELLSAADAAIAGGVNAVQLREKDTSPRDLRWLASQLRQVTSGRAFLLVNGPPKVALDCETDGVHLPEAAAMIKRPERPFLVGRSVHSLDAAKRAWAECADYLIAGPVYETASHPGSPPVGPSLISFIAAAVPIPVLGIGGITPERVEEVMRAGASGVAVVSAILSSPSPHNAARKLRQALDAAWVAREQVLG